MQQRTALISVTDKTGLKELVGVLHGELKWTIVATGSTHTYIEEQGFKDSNVMSTSALTAIADVEGANFGDFYPGGLVKTLHPRIHGGILYGKPEEQAFMDRMGIRPFHLVVCNPYPFQEAVSKGATLDEATKQIDIGGPTMLRAAGKGSLLHGNVIPVYSPEHYSFVAREARQGQWAQDTRVYLAEQAFRLTGNYDNAVADFLMEWQRTNRTREASTSQ